MNKILIIILNSLKPNKIEAIVTFLTNNIIVSIQQKKHNIVFHLKQISFLKSNPHFYCAENYSQIEKKSFTQAEIRNKRSIEFD